MRAVASSSPSVRNTPPETIVSVTDIRPHASIAAGVSVFARLPETDSPGRTRLVRFDLDREVLAGVQPPLDTSSRVTFGHLRMLARRSDHLFALPAAVELLSRRDHSEKELQRKLRSRGFSPGAIALALRRVQEQEYQSDDRFALSWTRYRMSGKGVSRTALLAGLARRGVDRETANRAVSAYEEENPDCFSRALRLALQALAGEEETTIVRKLARRGFDVVEIRRSLS
ncbi:MAG: regulatory protein RecX [Spirochaetaceae bacterium]|nr:MAG: regulatory protein RecX [Spirochaetaceae bacterium]